MNLLVTCEHGGNEVPREYRGLFRGAERALESHRGWDPGALELAERIAEELGVPLVAATVSRLVVDLNRSLSNRAVLSEWTRRLDGAGRTRLMARYYGPHREAVERLVRRLGRRGRAVHIAVHSFTPVLRGARRDADIGLLYDPTRGPERELCGAWRAALGGLRVRMNYPYRGTSDGLTSALRRRHGVRRYAGIELEVNQRLVRGPGWTRVQMAIVGSLRRVRESGAVPPERPCP